MRRARPPQSVHQRSNPDEPPATSGSRSAEARLAELEAQVALLTQALAAQTSRPETHVQEEPVVDDAPFNRRSLLTKLGGAAVAGVGAAVAGSTLQAQPAAADATQFSSDNSHAVIGTSTFISGAGVRGMNLGEGAPGQRMGVQGDVLAENGSFGVFGVHGDRVDAGAAPAGVMGTSTAADGVAGYSSTKVGVLGRSASGLAGIMGVRGEPPTLPVSVGPSGILGASKLAPGVVGFSESSVGVAGRGVRGVVGEGSAYGVVAAGGVAPLRLSPGAAVPPVVVESGLIFLNHQCDMYVSAGEFDQNPRWKKVMYEGEGKGSMGLLAAPVRLMDTRAGLPSIVEHDDQPFAAGDVFPFTVAGTGGVPGIPATATGVIGSIAVTGPTNAGHLQLFPGNLETTSTSVLNFVADQTVANAFTAALSPTGTLKLAARLAPPGGTTHVVIDITGFIY